MEDGRILFYNTQTGDGKLILKVGNKFDFSVDIWDDFESIPEAGMLVECSIEDGILKSLKSLELGVPIENYDFQKSGVNKDGATYSVTQTLKNYFSSVDSLIGEPPEVVNTKAQLDYFLSKRFLITAYNNLKNLDVTLHNHNDIKEQLNILQQLDKVYSTVSDRAELPQLAFEIIFMQSQPEYKQFIRDKEKYSIGIASISALLESLLPELEKKEAELKKVTNDDKKLKILEEKIKPLRGKYVDAVHEKAKYIEELSVMPNIKILYTEKYFHSFVSEFSKFSGQYQSILSKILNYKAYDLDKAIWMNASKSKSIQDHFIASEIKGDYSTKTYLSYYLDTLDKSMLGEEQKELFKLLEYLKKLR